MLEMESRCSLISNNSALITETVVPKRTVGRGRGWLKIHNANNVPCPVGCSTEPVQVKCDLPKESFQDVKLKAEYEGLRGRIGMIDLKDCSMNANDLLQTRVAYFIDYYRAICASDDEANILFIKLFNDCLLDEDLSHKLVFLSSSSLSCNEKICGTTIQRMFLSKLQQNIECIQRLHESSTVLFQNTVFMLSKYASSIYSKLRSFFDILSNTLMNVFEMLLDSMTTSDLKLLATHICMNGQWFRTDGATNLSQLMTKVRILLIGNNRVIEEEGKLWLLFLLEIASINFNPLSSNAFQFYENRLGSDQMKYFQKFSDALTIDATVLTNLKPFEGSVNVLQICSPATDNEFCENLTLNMNGTSNNVEDASAKGRAILGSGARQYGVYINENNFRYQGNFSNSTSLNDDNTSSEESSSNTKQYSYQRNVL